MPAQHPGDLQTLLVSYVWCTPGHRLQLSTLINSGGLTFSGACLHFLPTSNMTAVLYRYRYHKNMSRAVVSLLVLESTRLLCHV